MPANPNEYLVEISQQTATGAVIVPSDDVPSKLPNYTARIPKSVDTPSPDTSQEDLGSDFINNFDGGTNTVDGEKLCTGKLDFKKENGLIAADKVVVEADVIETTETKSGGGTEIDRMLGREVEHKNVVPSYTLNNNIGARKNLTEEQLEEKGISSKTTNKILLIRVRINASLKLSQKLQKDFKSQSYTPSGSTGGGSRLGEKIEELIPDQKTGYDNGYEFLSKCR